MVVSQSSPENNVDSDDSIRRKKGQQLLQSGVPTQYSSSPANKRSKKISKLVQANGGVSVNGEKLQVEKIHQVKPTNGQAKNTANHLNNHLNNRYNANNQVIQHKVTKPNRHFVDSREGALSSMTFSDLESTRIDFDEQNTTQIVLESDNNSDIAIDEHHKLVPEGRLIKSNLIYASINYATMPC
jgi:translation elongation factor P/translation initiation factor 5A